MTDNSLQTHDAAARLIAIMRRYCIDYVNRHDQDVTRDIMVEDYVLRMGDHFVRGRDGPYRAATAAQMGKFPRLGLTVHEIATSGARLMMRFSEHGRREKDGVVCAWGGIGLYSWDGEKLTANNVEQDYASRQRQISARRADPVDHPHPAPWDIERLDPDPAGEMIARAWLATGALSSTPGVTCDAGWAGFTTPALIRQEELVINDLFSVGPAVAFHVTQIGRATQDCGDPARADQPARLHSAGIVHIVDGVVAHGRIIRNRREMLKGPH